MDAPATAAARATTVVVPAGPWLLAVYLRRHGLTAADLAARLRPRVTPVAVARWARGARTPAPRYRPQLAAICGGEVPTAAWQTPREHAVAAARRAWLAAHPAPPPRRVT